MALTDQPTSLLQPLTALRARARVWLSSKSHSAVAQKVAGTAFIIRVGSAGLVYLSQILFARWMGPSEFGIYVYVWTWLLLLGALAPLGLAYLPQRFIPEYTNAGDLSRLRGYLFGSRWLCFALATVTSGLGAVAVYTLQDHFAAGYELPMLLALAALPIFTISSTHESISNAYSWVDLALLPGYIVRPVLMIAIMVVMHFAGWTVDAVAGMLAFLISISAVTLIQLVLLRKRLATIIPTGPRVYEAPRWLKTALPVFLVDGFLFLLTYIDVLLLKHFVGPEQIAQYYAASKTLALVAFIYFAVSSACAHRFAEYHNTGDREKLAAFVHQSTRMMFWPSLAMILVLILCGRWILMLFGPGFENSYPLILVLAIGLIARSSVGPAERLLNMVGQQKICAAIYCTAVAVNIGLCLTLIPRMGPTGAAIATASAIVTESVLLTLAVRARLGMTMFIGRRLFGG